MAHAHSREKKLYRGTSESFNFVDHVGANGVPRPLPAGLVPALYWPDGRWCYPANLYMADLVRRSLSRRNRGGTLHTYATQLSHLIRFCYRNDTDFIDLTDNQFKLFVRGLSSKDSNREINSVRAICNVCLEFLAYTGEVYGVPTFVSPDGAIKAARVKRTVYMGNGKPRSVLTWEHVALPHPSPPKERLPISSESIVALRKAAVKSSPNAFIKMRRLVLLLLLEVTGGRRGEVAELTIDAVRSAKQMDNPLMELVTLKKRGTTPSKRLIPISRHDIDYLDNYLQLYRNPHVRRIFGNIVGDGKVLVSDTSGTGLQPNTITQEVWTLRLHSGLSVPVCAHMFRHRFCTKVLISLIEEHKERNADEFRQRLISNNDLMTKLTQWTGQSSIESLQRYIHLAFEEFAHTKQVVNSTIVRQKLDSFKARLLERGLLAEDPLLAKMIDSFLGELSDA